MPGHARCLIIESMAQACAVLALARLTEEQRNDGSLYFFAGIDNARFKKVVQPGDQLKIHCHFLKDRAGIGKFEATAMVDDQVACVATMMCARRKMD